MKCGDQITKLSQNSDKNNGIEDIYKYLQVNIEDLTSTQQYLAIKFYEIREVMKQHDHHDGDSHELDNIFEEQDCN